MAVVGNLKSLSRLVINNTKTISRISKPSSCFESLMSQRNLLTRQYNQLVRMRKASVGSVFCEHVSRVHTKGDKELVEFLEEEIKTELKTPRSPTLPDIDGFTVKTNAAEIIMTKKFNTETINVTMNVNHSVESEETDESPQDQSKEPQEDELVSKPSFTVTIEKGGKTVALACCFSVDMLPEEQSQDSYNDLFQLRELTIYDKEWEDETYSVSGSNMDGLLYDLLINMLEERGIDNEFADKLINYCTSYEHGLYVGLLKDLKTFVSEK